MKSKLRKSVYNRGKTTLEINSGSLLWNVGFDFVFCIESLPPN